MISLTGQKLQPSGTQRLLEFSEHAEYEMDRSFKLAKTELQSQAPACLVADTDWSILTAFVLNSETKYSSYMGALTCQMRSLAFWPWQGLFLLIQPMWCVAVTLHACKCLCSCPLTQSV